MDKKKLKQLKHKVKQEKAGQTKYQKTKRIIEQTISNPDHGATPMLIATWQEIKDRRMQHKYRLNVLRLTSSATESKAHSRTMLSEYSMVWVQGVISDVREYEKPHHYKILINHPYIVQARFADDPTFRIIHRQLDSHIWIDSRDVEGYDDHMHCQPTISIGDTIFFWATPKLYSGKINNHHAKKYGLTSIYITDCGIPIKSKKGVHICSLFDRYGDWVVKYHNLPSLKEIAHVLNAGKSFKRELKYTTRPSKYMNYYDRMDLIKEDRKHLTDDIKIK